MIRRRFSPTASGRFDEVATRRPGARPAHHARDPRRGGDADRGHEQPDVSSPRAATQQQREQDLRERQEHIRRPASGARPRPASWRAALNPISEPQRYAEDRRASTDSPSTLAPAVRGTGSRRRVRGCRWPNRGGRPTARCAWPRTRACAWGAIAGPSSVISGGVTISPRILDFTRVRHRPQRGRMHHAPLVAGASPATGRDRPRGIVCRRSCAHRAAVRRRGVSTIVQTSARKLTTT